MFDTALSATTNTDRVTDFTAGRDKLRLDEDVFSVLNAATSTSLAEAQFHAAPAAQDAEDRIIYTTTGELFYESDGTGAIVGVRFATLGSATHPVLSAADFLIVG